MMGDYICCDYTDSKLLITVGWLILYAKHRTLSKLTECFVQYNLSDQAERGGTRGKIRGKKEKRIKMQNRGKSHHGGWLQRRDENSRGKMAFSISPSLPPSLPLALSISLSHLIHYADIHSICFLSEPPALQRSWNAHTSE